jgi:integrase
LLHAGVPVKTVASMLGHANAAITLSTYAHLMESAEEEASAKLARALGL